MLAALRDDRDIDADMPGDVPFETVAEEVFSRYGRRWKPRTLAANRRYLHDQILPFFAGRPIAEIDREEVQRWFRSLHATPAAANRSAPILSVIMQQAEAWGYRPDGGNPCKVSGATGRSARSGSCLRRNTAASVWFWTGMRPGSPSGSRPCACFC